MKIRANDSDETRQAKLKIQARNLKEFERVKEEKMDEIVVLLDKFKGQLSLTDILNQDIPLLNELGKAKDRLNGEILKERDR